MTQLAVKSVTVGAVVMITVETLLVVGISRLHLQDEISARNIGILRIKHATVSLKCATNLVPASLVESIEVISPCQVKITGIFIPVIDLNIVEKQVPWHINRVEIFAPCMESRRPEVHSQGLLLIHEIDSLIVISVKSSDYITVDSE